MRAKATLVHPGRLGPPVDTISQNNAAKVSIRIGNGDHWHCLPWNRDKRRGDNYFTAAAMARRLHNDKKYSFLGCFSFWGVSPFLPKICRMLVLHFKRSKSCRTGKYSAGSFLALERPLRFGQVLSPNPVLTPFIGKLKYMKNKPIRAAPQRL